MLGKIFGALALLAGLQLPAAAQTLITETGPIAHPAAETSFPERVGSWRRVNTARFGANDLSASYELIENGERLLLSVYIFPMRDRQEDPDRDRYCRWEFDGARNAVGGGVIPVRLVASGRPPGVDQVEPDLSHRAVFELGSASEGRAPPRSELYLYCFVSGGEWMVKYRVTYAPAFRDAEAAIASFIRTGPWPGRRPAESIAWHAAPHPVGSGAGAP